MIDAHGGTVEAHAGGDGTGTIIRMTLPLATPPATQLT
jgi:K+-sensing histidine kinase KdpD